MSNGKTIFIHFSTVQKQELYSKTGILQSSERKQHIMSEIFTPLLREATFDRMKMQNYTNKANTVSNPSKNTTSAESHLIVLSMIQSKLSNT